MLIVVGNYAKFDPMDLPVDNNPKPMYVRHDNFDEIITKEIMADVQSLNSGEYEYVAKYAYYFDRIEKSGKGWIIYRLKYVKIKESM